MSSPCHIKKKKKDFSGCPVQGIMVPPSPHPQGLREASIVSWGDLLADAQGPCPPGLVRSSLPLSSPSSTAPPSLRLARPRPAGHPAPRRRPLTEVGGGGMGEPQRAGAARKIVPSEPRRLRLRHWSPRRAPRGVTRHRGRGLGCCA